MSNKQPGHEANDASESTPLLGGNGEASTPPRDTRSNGDGTPKPLTKHRGVAYRFLFDTDAGATPGMDSNQPVVRSLAYVWHVIKATLLSGYINFLLLIVPVGIVAGHYSWGATAVFTINFFAIVPLAAVLTFATEAISHELGEALGGLLNATFGNAIELIVSIVALKENQIEIVQASMLGSILSNLLLVMGMCFLFGGMVHRRDEKGNGTEQSFASAYAQTTCSMMTLSSASLVIPAALYGVLGQGNRPEDETKTSILILSRGTAIILLALYVLYLIFQLITHPNLFKAGAKPKPKAESQDVSRIGIMETRVDKIEEILGLQEGEDDEKEEAPPIGPIAAGAVLIVTTILVSICADYLVGSIDDIVKTTGISKAFIGLILLPIVGNAAEHVTAVVVAVHDRMDLAMGVAIGSSIQIAILVTPFLVIVGWIIDRDMTLRFETFQTVAFAVSVLVVTYIVQDGKSNYLEGAMLIGLYAIIALAFYATPGLDSAMPPI